MGHRHHHGFKNVKVPSCVMTSRPQLKKSEASQKLRNNMEEKAIAPKQVGSSCKYNPKSQYQQNEMSSGAGLFWCDPSPEKPEHHHTQAEHGGVRAAAEGVKDHIYQTNAQHAGE